MSKPTIPEQGGRLICVECGTDYGQVSRDRSTWPDGYVSGDHWYGAGCAIVEFPFMAAAWAEVKRNDRCRRAKK